MLRPTATAVLTAVAALLALAPAAAASEATVHVVRYEDDGQGGRRVIGTGEEPAREGAAEALDAVRETSAPQLIAEHLPLTRQRVVTLRSRSLEALRRTLASRGVAPQAPRPETEEAMDEVVTLVDSGPSANRIDLVFMGDGYTAAERETFFADMQRMVHEMFQGQTFASYLPLFNVHAVFRASAESGIGRGRAKNTAYRLYREGVTLRAIYPGDTAAARASCAAAPGCDYPVIIANDPHYGGLGGEFAISTSSPTSGTIVLRHELGHNFGRVGEEYDGGGYFGANVSTSVAALKWRHWATEPNALRAEPATARFLAWPWHDLSRGPFTADFTSDGRQARASVRVSASGIATDDQLRVTLDGEPLPFRAPGTDDRVFHDIDLDRGFSAGRHVIRFEELVRDANNWISSLTVHEYAPGYRFDPEFVGAYPLFADTSRVAAYRATDETCLMRDMKSTRFCSICQENNWLEFFGAVKLIDRVDVARGDSGVTVTLATQKLGQLRTDTAADGSRIEVTWLRNGAEVPALAGLMQWTLPTRDAGGRWEVRVRFVTPEVRLDTRGLLTDKKTLEI